MRKSLLVIFVALFLASCANQTILSSNVSEKNLDNPDETNKSIFFLNGMFYQKSLVKSDCEEIKAVITKLTIGDLLLSGFSLGIFTPRTYEVYCQ